MSEVETVYTKKYDGLTYLGWTACGIIFVIQLFWEFIFGILDISVQIQIGPIMSRISGTFGVLLLISYFNYVRQLPDSQMKLVGGLLAGTAFIKAINVFFGINLGVVNFLLNPVLLIPVVILFVFYWNYGPLPKILAGAYSLRILLQLVIGIIDIFGYPPSFLFRLRRYTYLITLLLLVYWFFLGIPDLKGVAISTTKPAPIASRRDTYIESGTETGSGTGIPPSTSGWTHGVPRLAFWCETCDKNVKYRPKSNKDIEKAHPCPTCGTSMKAWWVEPTREGYFKFAGGGVIFIGALMTYMFETAFGQYGLDPLILLTVISAIEIATGLLIMRSGIKMTHTGPPAYATTTVSIEPQKVFLQEVIMLVIIIFIGAAVVYGINAGLLAIVFG